MTTDAQWTVRRSQYTDLLREIVAVYTSLENVTDQNALDAIVFAELIDQYSFRPVIVVSNMGRVCFMWQQREKLLLVTPDEKVMTYVVEFGRERRQGAAPMTSCMPTTVQEMIDTFQEELN